MNEFQENERFFRKIPDNPDMIKKDGTITSAVFKDSNGCSVDRKAGRKDEDIYANFVSRFSGIEGAIKAVADVSKQNCEEKNMIILELPEEDNPHHCEIHRSSDRIMLSPSQAKHLSRVANVHYLDSE